MQLFHIRDSSIRPEVSGKQNISVNMCEYEVDAAGGMNNLGLSLGRDKCPSHSVISRLNSKTMWAIRNNEQACDEVLRE